MPQNHGFRTNARRSQQHKVRAQQEDKEETNPLLKAFYGYARQLDDKHDRYERIIKLSRDITIESKRIIFLLHTIDGRKNNRERIVAEAEHRLKSVIEHNFKAVTLELVDQDPYQYRGAISPGLQEFIEAYTFMEFLKQCDDVPTRTEQQQNFQTMSDWEMLQQKMQYVVKPEEPHKEAEDNETTIVAVETLEEQEVKTIQFFVDPHEFIRGVADLTGELMRRCINSLGSGETHVCLATCKVLQQFYAGYISLHVQRCRELSRKISTMRQSVLKAEQICYNVKVRGGEAAKWGSMYDNKVADEVDEGFF